MDELLTSAQAAARLGVGVSAVKRWAESGQLPCVKTAGGHRRFTVQSIVDFHAGHAKQAAADTWSPWFAALAAPSSTFALLALLCEARATRGSWQQVMTLVGGLLTVVGERWERGELTVAHEHLVSAALERALAQIADTLPVPRTAPRCVLASVAGDVHTLGLSMAEVCLREMSWSSEWLGAPTATAHVLEHLRSRDIQMVALSASLWSSNKRALAREAKVIGEACRQARVPLVVGGRGAWPDQLPYGQRLHDWEQFQRLLTALLTSRDR
jgi:excisionase family DNA binding protein